MTAVFARDTSAFTFAPFHELFHFNDDFAILQLPLPLTVRDVQKVVDHELLLLDAVWHAVVHVRGAVDEPRNLYLSEVGQTLLTHDEQVLAEEVVVDQGQRRAFRAIFSGKERKLAHAIGVLPHDRVI